MIDGRLVKRTLIRLSKTLELVYLEHAYKCSGVKITRYIRFKAKKKRNS